MILDRIVKVKKQEVEQLRSALNLRQAESVIAKLPPTRGFAAALSHSEDIALIAEVKKASPSKGIIRPDFDPVRIAKQYEAAGANAISVLTDVQFFQGDSSYLSEIRKRVSLPLLRKDFVIDEYQIYEARLLGADAILLIASLLSVDELRKFQKLASELGLDALVETHNREEMKKAVTVDASLIGINNRNLQTFEVDLQTSVDLAKELPADALLVSESGIFANADVQFVKQAGAKAILVGESLIRSADPLVAVDELMGRKKLKA